VPTISPVASPTPTLSATPSSTPIPLSTAGLATYRAPGFTFSYPSDWQTLDVIDVVILGGSGATAMLANFPLSGCPALDINCLLALKVPPGGVLMSVGAANHLETIFDPGEHWTATIDRMPARVMSRPGYVGIDELRDWLVAEPSGIHGELVVEAALRGPGLSALDAEVDGLARSIRFDLHPPSLDPAAAAVALARGVTYLDRPGNIGLPTPVGCFPRAQGERRVTVRTWSGIALPAAMLVTCTSRIEATTVDLWRVSLSVRWAAGGGRAAGEWREAVYFDGQGTWIGVEQLTPNATPLRATP